MTDSSMLISVLTKLGITPKDITLFETACVHRSFLNENKVPEHNERLEFL